MSESAPPVPPTALAQLLAERGKSQAELGRDLGVTRPTIFNWVHGKERVPRRRQAQMRLILDGVGLDLFDERQMAKAAPPATHPGAGGAR